MKYFRITYYAKGSDRNSHSDYKGTDYIAREAMEEAEQFANSKNRHDSDIQEITKEQFDFFNNPE